jgi:hypothetical protein
MLGCMVAIVVLVMALLRLCRCRNKIKNNE